MHLPLNTRQAITDFLFLEDPPQPVDLSFVLGSPTISSIIPAVELYKNGLTKKIVISGHGPKADSTPEWKIYQDYASIMAFYLPTFLWKPSLQILLKIFDFLGT